MDPRQNLVIIKGQDQTEEVKSVVLKGSRSEVTYNSGKKYSFLQNNVEVFSNPKCIEISNESISAAGDILTNVKDVLDFKEWVKIIHTSGRTTLCPNNQFSIREEKDFKNLSNDILGYFRELAEAVSLKTTDGESLLAMKYRKLEVISNESILSKFIQQNPISQTSELPSFTIFPFGCNKTQRVAIEKAIKSPVSIIQGPPGTGKTQTILNLIANFLLQEKRIAIVSNNNSATENVLDKLKKYELDFIAAFLGNNENKKTFIDNQKSKEIDLPVLEARVEETLKKKATDLNTELQKALSTKNKLSDIEQMLDALTLELTHFNESHIDIYGKDSYNKLLKFKLSASEDTLLKAWLSLERKAKGLNKYFKPKSSNPVVSLLDKIDLLLRFGIRGKILFNLSLQERIPILQRAYYLSCISSLEKRQQNLENFLADFRFEPRLKKLTEVSMQLLKHVLAKKYNKRKRRIFSQGDLNTKPEDFFDEYPVVLSTTFSVITSVKNGYLFDCVIIDEASQVDLLNGVLAMACAKKIVVVGDQMQLPNILTKEDAIRAKKIAPKYNIPPYANFEIHNLLSAIQNAFKDAPNTLLREHYRCHPKIIQFCNQKFYRGQLLVMTKDLGEEDVLKAFVTVEGNHARGTFNQRQIDEVIKHVLPDLEPVDQNEVGIVSPYREQASRIKETTGSREIEVDTVHKYQGREKRIMIITTVSNKANKFIDDPNLLNVAVSRAQDKIRLVVSKKIAEGHGNIADLVRYIQYNNCEVISGKVRSVFDLLYSDYTETRFKTITKYTKVSAYDSENLAYKIIKKVLSKESYHEYRVVFQYPLKKLIKCSDSLSEEERKYATNPWTKTDFLIYRKIDKIPVLVIEVDGYKFHRAGTRQAKRDQYKDSILEKSDISILRLSTTGSDEFKRIANKLDALKQKVNA